MHVVDLHGLLIIFGMRHVLLLSIKHALPLNQLAQRFHLACTLYKSVAQQFSGRSSAIRVFDEALCDEVFEVSAPLVTLEAWCGIFGNVEEDLHWVYAGIGGFSVGHLQSGDTERPYICLEVITGFLNDFGGHPEGGTNKGHALGLDVDELGGDTKIGQLDLAGVAQQRVCSLDVAVYLAGRVEVVEAEEQFADDDGDVGFGEGTRFELV